MASIVYVTAKKLSKVFHRSEVRDYGEGDAICPGCSGSHYVNGVIGEQRQTYHCHGSFSYIMAKPKD